MAPFDDQACAPAETDASVPSAPTTGMARAPESASDILGSRARPLEALFSPKAVAVVGAEESQESAGRVVLRNLIRNPFGGTVYPVNPKAESVLGVKAYATVNDIPEPIDLAVIATPTSVTADALEDAGKAGARAAVITSAVFRESGIDAEQHNPLLMAHARKYNMRLLGPNSLGVMCPPRGLNAAFVDAQARAGTVGFISQSNALASAVLAWSLRELVGFSAFVSVGSMLDVGWGDLIHYLGDDANTRSIVIYMETVGDARAFLSAAREVALAKPVIVVKAGRTPAAAAASLAHTGASAGSDEVLDAAFRRCGVLRVDTVADLFHMAEVLAKQPRPRGPRLTIVSNAGGPGVLATDSLVRSGGEPAVLSDETLAGLDAILPARWSRSNPIDILGDADPERYAKAVSIAANDANSDGLLVILTGQSLTDPARTAEALAPHAKLQGKPLLATWMGGDDVQAGETVLNAAGIPVFAHPESAARAFSYMWQYSYNLRGIYETPSLAHDGDANEPDRQGAEAIVQGVRAAGRSVLLWSEAERLLAAYGMPAVETLVASDEAQAVRYARAIGYPVIMKPLRDAITQETGLGGVQLNLVNADAVRHAFHVIREAVVARAGARSFIGVSIQPMVKRASHEVVLSSRIDPQFGLVLSFGAGGRLGTAFRDRALGLPPQTTTLARRMIEQTRVYAALRGEPDGVPMDIEGLENLIVRFSYLVVEQRWIREIELNPLLATPDGPVVLGARVTLHPPDVTEEMLPRLAIRPYPVQYVSDWEMRNGAKVTIRPIRPEDEPLIVDFHKNLSDQSIYMRFFHAMRLSQRVAHDRMVRICFNDYDREIALVAEYHDLEAETTQVLGVVRLSKVHGTADAEFSLLVNDAYQGLGLGSEMLKRLLRVARDEKVERVLADILPENYVMQHVCEKLGFVLKREMGADMVKAQVVL